MPASKNWFLPSFQTLWWTCMPDPLSWKRGFGISVTVLPWRRATFLTAYLYFSSLSPMLTSESKRMSISAWPAVPTSW